MPERPVPEQDPVVSQSYSIPILISAVLLMVTVAWSLWDEVYGARPWKRYQQRFVRQYTAYLERLTPTQARSEEAVRQSAEYQRLEQAIAAAEKQIQPKLKEIDHQVNQVITTRVAALNDVFQVARSKVAALTYQMETSASQRRKESLKSDIEEYKKGPFRAKVPAADGSGRTERVTFAYEQLEQEYNGLKQRKAGLLAERVELTRRPNELRAQRDAYLKDHLEGLNEEQIAALIRKMQGFDYKIKQVHVPGVDLVDRCQSCHVGILEPVTLTKASMGGEGAFTSHPNKELLKIHDPERFGCTTCHGGNGRATTSVKKAHGHYEHWLWPLYAPENVEAGCQQCHAADMVLEEAEVLTAGKELYREKGCNGCHRYEGFDPESERLQSARLAMRALEARRKDGEHEVAQTIRLGDQAADNATAQRLYARAEALRQGLSRMDNEMEQLTLQASSLMREQKKVGPNLKEIRVKLRPQWLPVWITNPHAFRPTTKMPRFRLLDDEVKSIAAYLWQTAVQQPLPAQPPGDPVHGKESFETRGCLACHSVGEGSQRVGGDFAANLTRLGEKANYEYIVRWIHNPRERTLPYCPLEKRDIGPPDYARKGLPFQFDLDHTRCPNDDAEMQTQNMTVMPSLRLSWEETRDIASYLISLKQKDPSSYATAPFLDDSTRKNRGAFLIRNYGCPGCHEISGFEEEGRIGTELTTEGSKPIERLDFALLTHEAKAKDWYNHKGFIERKLENPAIWDEGREKPHLDMLKMPKPNLTRQDITALTTFLLGSVDPTLPPQYRYLPADQRKDIQEGWWVVTKYNCMGCHQVGIGQRSVLMSLPRYQEADWKEQLPPRLVGEGARVDPGWLLRFLSNPAMSATDTDRNGTRPYLKVRMPTFFFSEGELRKLVRFFGAMASQPQPYIQARLEPLTEQEMTLARQLFTHPAAPCLKCHATGDAAHDRNATAPNFLLAKDRLKPGWTQRWMVDPSLISPGTSMPSGLFRREGPRWVFSGPTPPAFAAYTKDHVDLLTRYMFQLTPDEQRRLLSTRTSASLPARDRRPVLARLQ